MPQVEPFPIHDQDVSHVIIEIFGGDNNLSSFVIEDMQEMAAGNTGNFSVLALADFADDRAYVIELSPRTGNRVIDRVGEIDTGDPETLVQFLSRALVSYGPNVHKAIGFWDHGSGVFDEYDPNETLIERRLSRVSRKRRSRSFPARRLFFSRAELARDMRARAMLHDDTNGGVLTNLEARNVMEVAFSRAEQEGKVALIFSDTCLNGMIEVLDQLKEFAECVVASEDLEPGDGWEYREWLEFMSGTPPEDAGQWGRQAVEAFEAGYANQPYAHPCTLGAFRTDHTVTTAFRDLLEVVGGSEGGGFAAMQQARAFTQSFANKDTYDLKDFILKLKDASTESAVQSSAGKVLEAFEAARIHSVALGDMVSDSHGLGFWFPSSRYSFRRDKETYERLEFNKATDWVSYLGSLYG